MFSKKKRDQGDLDFNNEVTIIFYRRLSKYRRSHQFSGFRKQSRFFRIG